MKRSYLNPVGKQGKLWLKTRAKWFKLFPADYYSCYLCQRSLMPYQVTLDHVEARSRKPEWRNELHNLRPCCYACNQKKGSLSLEQYKAKLD